MMLKNDLSLVLSYFKCTKNICIKILGKILCFCCENSFLSMTAVGMTEQNQIISGNPIIFSLCKLFMNWYRHVCTAYAGLIRYVGSRQANKQARLKKPCWDFLPGWPCRQGKYGKEDQEEERKQQEGQAPAAGAERGNTCYSRKIQLIRAALYPDWGHVSQEIKSDKGH